MKLTSTQYLTFFALMYLSPMCFAESDDKPIAEQDKTEMNTSIPDPMWSGSIEYGVIATSGNTNTKSESAKATVQYKKNVWLNTVSWNFLKASDSGATSADQTFVRSYTKYIIVNADYLFLALNYERDSFSGFVNRTTETLGYGFSMVKTASFDWNIELGVGARQTRRTDGISPENFISRLGTNVTWKINKNSQISEVLFMEKGDDNTFTESLTSIKLRINGALSLHIDLKIKNNSIVPVDIKQTDTQTTVNIAYDF